MKEEIIARILSDLSLALIAGSLGSVGTTWFKTMFDSTSKAVNLMASISMVTIFSFLVVVHYNGGTMQEFALVTFYGNIGAKTLYEAVKTFTGAGTVEEDEAHG